MVPRTPGIEDVSFCIRPITRTTAHFVLLLWWFLRRRPSTGAVLRRRTFLRYRKAGRDCGSRSEIRHSCWSVRHGIGRRGNWCCVRSRSLRRRRHGPISACTFRARSGFARQCQLFVASACRHIMDQRWFFVDGVVWTLFVCAHPRINSRIQIFRWNPNQFWISSV